MLNVNANMFVQVSYMDEQNKKRKEKFHFNACFFSNENLFDRSICNDDDFASYFPTLRSFFCNSLGNVYTDLKFKNLPGFRCDDSRSTCSKIIAQCVYTFQSMCVCLCLC